MMERYPRDVAVSFPPQFIVEMPNGPVEIIEVRLREHRANRQVSQKGSLAFEIHGRRPFLSPSIRELLV